MSWNYRIMRRVDSVPAGREAYYVVVEAYYNKGITSWSEGAAHPQGESVGALVKDLARFAAALAKPVLMEVDTGVVELTPADILKLDIEIALEREACK